MHIVEIERSMALSATQSDATRQRQVSVVITAARENLAMFATPWAGSVGAIVLNAI